MQLILRRGSFDIDDVLLNTIGAVIGYTVYRIGKRLH
ncbi:VanZ family protein [Paenibacillus sp. sptzw28]|nr:VanZ family protein [Paenibacillus sp. sptzw28]